MNNAGTLGSGTKVTTFEKEEKMTIFLMFLGALFIFMVAVELWIFFPRITSALMLGIAVIAIVANSGLSIFMVSVVAALCLLGIIVASVVQALTFKDDLNTLKKEKIL
jgi:cell division protein FtsW (lipid II flippase)